MFYFWLLIVIILAIFEIMTINLVSIWFVISGIIAMILSFFIDSFEIQFSVFVILGAILLLMTRKCLKKYISKSEKTNLDRVVGMKGIVTEEIRENDIGEVKVDGKKWSSYADQSIKQGSIIKVLKIDGVKLKVEIWKE